MSKKIQLKIAEPCHENWDNMTPDAKGKFCGSCQKQVVDFSDMSDRQVAEFFKKPSTGSVCGRFMTDQLDRPMEIPRKRIPWIRYFFQIAIPAFLVSIKASASANGRIKPQTVTTDTTKRPEHIKMGMVARPRDPQPVDTVKPVKDPEMTRKGEISVVQPVKQPTCDPQIMGGVSFVDPKIINQKEIEGIVVNEKGDPVPFASIVTNKFNVMADENGTFKLKKNWRGSGLELSVSSAGYETKKMMLSKNNPGRVVVQLNSNVVLPEVIVSAYNTISCSRITMGLPTVKGQTIVTGIDTVYNMTRQVEPIPENNSLLVYPNPVATGSSVNLSLKKQEEGYYQLQIINLAGQPVDQKEIWIDAEARILNVDLPMVSAGTYFMILTNKKTGKKYSEKIIVQ